MRLDGNHVLITGGASGIGFALAEAFLEAGSKVAICGRREDRLAAARAKYPRLLTRVCDVADNASRVALRDWASEAFPALNVLVNNAGVQRDIDFTQGADEFSLRPERTRRQSGIRDRSDRPVRASARAQGRRDDHQCFLGTGLRSRGENAGLQRQQGRPARVLAGLALAIEEDRRRRSSKSCRPPSTPN